MSRRHLHHHLVWSLGAAVVLSAVVSLPMACSHEWEELRFAGAATGGGTTGSTSTGGSGTGAGAAGGSGGHTSSTTTATGVQGGNTGCPENSGECDGESDCEDSTCVALSECGYRVCVRDVPEATSCEQANDQCCNSAQCDVGQTCLAQPLEPSCTGVGPPQYNVCASDACDPDDPSPLCVNADEICVPAGALDRKVARCMPTSCLQDSDCEEQADGRCVPVTPYCCDGPVGLYCVYSGGCVNQADCDVHGAYCVVAQGRGSCSNDEPTCI